MNSNVTINRILAVIALLLAIASFFIDGPPLLTVAVILLAIALIA